MSETLMSVTNTSGINCGLNGQRPIRPFVTSPLTNEELDT